MKKTYIKPNMQVVIMTSRQAIMAGSVDGLEGFGGNGGQSNEDDYAD